MDNSGGAVGAATLRRISWRLLPLIGMGYCIAILDRGNISFASLQMNRDLLTATIYSFGAGLFSIGNALFEIPSNLALFRFGARQWIARIMLTWGVLAMRMVLVKTPAHLYLVRFLLGIAEAGFFPGVAFYLTRWYPAEMRARAISRFYIAGPLAGMANGLLAGPLLRLNGSWACMVGSGCFWPKAVLRYC
jgi:MFS transporter, ACS family, tartrate transporter